MSDSRSRLLVMFVLMIVHMQITIIENCCLAISRMFITAFGRGLPPPRRNMSYLPL